MCTPLVQFPTELREDFSSGFNSSKWVLWQGNTSTVSGRCGPLQGKETFHVFYHLLNSLAGQNIFNDGRTPEDRPNFRAVKLRVAQ